MSRVVFILILAASLLGAAASLRLYLTDGTHHVVREYEVKEDRVRFYSLERSQWEEIPLDLIDLKRTEAEFREKQALRREQIKILDAEDEAERAHRREVASVPMDKGAYLVDGEQIRPIPQAELKMETSRGRTILQVLSPVPIVPGKTTVELDGEHSAFIITTDKPEFYVRLHDEQRFGIIRVKTEKKKRLAQTLNIVPVSNEIYEEQDEVEVFRREVAYNLYKIWPEEPLEPGEYAVIEFMPGKGNIRVWDFAYRPAGKPGK